MVWAGTSVVGSSAAMEVAPTKDGSAIVRPLKHSKMREYQGKGIYTAAFSPVPAPAPTPSSSQESEA